MRHIYKKRKTGKAFTVVFCRFDNRFALMNCLCSHRASLIQDILRGNRGCENVEDGRKKSRPLFAATTSEKFHFTQ